jgi:hypothetical protein
MRVRQIAVLLVLGALPACASFGGGGGTPGRKALKKATIELYRDENEVCKTNTTPFFALKKGTGRKLAWEINDETGCLTGALQVVIQFKGGENPDLLPSCDKRGNASRKRIECDLDNQTVVAGKSAYSVLFDGQTEDPVLQIEQF